MKQNPNIIDSPNITPLQLPSRTINMLRVRAADAARMIYSLNWLAPKWTNPLVSLFAIILLIGFLQSLIYEDNVLHWYVLFYTALLLLWPFQEGVRFLFPLLPFLYLYLITGLQIVLRSITSPNNRKLYIVALIFSALMLIYTSYDTYQARNFSRQAVMSVLVWFIFFAYISFVMLIQRRVTVSSQLDHQSFISHTDRTSKSRWIHLTLKVFLVLIFITSGLIHITSRAHYNLHANVTTFRHFPGVQVSEWLLQNTRKDEIIMADDYAIIHRLTTRKTLRFPLTTDVKIIRDFVLNNDIDYIVILNEKPFEYYLPSTIKRFDRLLNKYAAMFTPVYSFENGTVYLVL